MTEPATSATQGPAAFTSARARIVCRRPVGSSRRSMPHNPPARCAETQAVRGAMVAPRAAASLALSTDQPRIIHPAIGVFEAAHARGFQRSTRGIGPQIERARRRQAPPAAQMVVEEQAEPQQPGGAQGAVMRQHETQRPDDVRRDAPQHLALAQRLADQTEFVVFEVTQAAMDQLGRSAGGAGAEIGTVAQMYAPAAPGRIAGNAGSVDAATDDGEIVVGPVGRRGAQPRLLPPAWVFCSD